MSKIEAAFEKAAAPICEENGVFIYDVEYKKESKDYFLRLFIDKEGGVTIEDCERVSRAMNGLLDNSSLISGAYIFEVSSPGIERLLTRDWHYDKAIGEKINVKLFSPKNGKKELCGVLKSATENAFVIDDGTGELTIEKKEAATVRLAFDF